MRAYIVNQSSRERALKIQFNEQSGSFLLPNISELWKFFQNQLCCLLDKINTQIQEDFEEFFVTKQGFLVSKKYKKKKKKIVLSTMPIQHRVCSSHKITPIYFIRLSKVWSMLHHGSVGRVQSKECYYVFTYTFFAFFFVVVVVVFPHKFVFFTFYFFF